MTVLYSVKITFVVDASSEKDANDKAESVVAGDYCPVVGEHWIVRKMHHKTFEKMRKAWVALDIWSTSWEK